jgi:hypothetical protein
VSIPDEEVINTVTCIFLQIPDLPIRLCQIWFSVAVSSPLIGSSRRTSFLFAYTALASA